MTQRLTATQVREKQKQRLDGISSYQCQVSGDITYTYRGEQAKCTRLAQMSPGDRKYTAVRWRGLTINGPTHFKELVDKHWESQKQFQVREAQARPRTLLERATDYFLNDLIQDDVGCSCHSCAPCNRCVEQHDDYGNDRYHKYNRGDIVVFEDRNFLVRKHPNGGLFLDGLTNDEVRVVDGPSMTLNPGDKIEVKADPDGKPTFTLSPSKAEKAEVTRIARKGSLAYARDITRGNQLSAAIAAFNPDASYRDTLPFDLKVHHS